MNALIRLFGVPHEGLHLLALVLIGRRARRWTPTHVDLPDDLSTRQYVFVAGLPALVFGGLALMGMLGLLEAQSPTQALLALIAIVGGGLGFAGTLGDLSLIARRIAADGHSAG